MPVPVRQDLIRIDSAQLDGKRVIVREDFNVPLQNGRITDESRLNAALPGLRAMHAAGARLRIVSHLGRPNGKPDPTLSLAPVAARLRQLWPESRMRLQTDWMDADDAADHDEVLLYENIRFHPGEITDEDALAKHLAARCDVYVNDAFAVCHRRHASVHAIIRHAPRSGAGPLLLDEIEHLAHALDQPIRPVTAVVGGAKLESKLKVLQALLYTADSVIVGGGCANALLAAHGQSVGASTAHISEQSRLAAQALIDHPHSSRLLLPVDAVTADAGAPLTEDTPAQVKAIDDIAATDMIFDLGPRTRERITETILAAGTILWSGPVGLFELSPFATGTRDLVLALKKSTGYSIVGGGDTLAALAAFGGTDSVSCRSTGGSAFLQFIESGHLPAIDALVAANLATKTG